MSIIQELKGTASELKENRAYNMLVKRVGEAGAIHAIKTKLHERGVSEKEWEMYRKVRKVMHSNPLGVSKVLNEVDILTDVVFEG